MRVRLAIALPLVLCGCAISRTHIGIFNMGDGTLWDSVVGKRFVEPLRDTEDDWMRQLTLLDLNGLSEHFTPKLAKKINFQVRQQLALQLKRQYGPNGTFSRRLFATPALSWGRAARTDAFDYYDMVGYAYDMEGKITGCVQFYVTKMNGELAICGIEVLPENEADREKAKEIRYLAPPTVDKSGVAARPGMLMKPLKS